MVIDPDARSSGSNGRLKSPQYAGASRQACRSTVPTRWCLCGGSAWPAAAAGPPAMPAASRALKAHPAKRWFTGFFVLLVRFGQQFGKSIERLLGKALERIVLCDNGHSIFIVADFKEP